MNLTYAVEMGTFKNRSRIKDKGKEK